MYSCIIHGWSSHAGHCPSCQELQMTSSTEIVFPNKPIHTENITIDQRYVFEQRIKKLETLAAWASGKDFDVLSAEYEAHKVEFPELHE